MTDLTLICLDFQECHLLPRISSCITEIIASKVTLRKVDSDIDKHFHPERGQYNASAILSEYEKTDSESRAVLITSVDLYIPIFTFVFGLTKLNGQTGIVSAYRLRSEYYGLPSDEDLLISRLTKEVVHEFGHLLNLRHCFNYHCVMASSNTADDLDIKGSQFCKSCLSSLDNVF